MAKYNVYLGNKEVRSNLSEKDSKMVVGSLRAGQALKKLRGQPNLKVKRKKFYFIKEPFGLPFELTKAGEFRRFIVVDENLRPVSGIRGQSKSVATKIKREWTKCSKDKKHRLYKFCKRRKYEVMELK